MIGLFRFELETSIEPPPIFRSIAALQDAIFNARISEQSQIVIITDDLKGLNYETLGDVLVVPREYAAKGAIMKARSLQYATEAMSSDSKVWIMHLDEESIVTEQTVRAICDYILSNRGVLVEGPIFYSLAHSEASSPARLTEAIRSSGCYNCMKTMRSGDVPMHLHGSNLLVRADVEKEVGWNRGETVAEDQLFGI